MKSILDQLTAVTAFSVRLAIYFLSMAAFFYAAGIMVRALRFMTNSY